MGTRAFSATVATSPAMPGRIEMFKQIIVGVDEHEGGCDATACVDKSESELPVRDNELLTPCGLRSPCRAARGLQRLAGSACEAWEETGFEVGKVDDWLRAGCFNPDASEDMDDFGISPTMPSMQTEVGTGSYVDMVAHTVAVGDVGLQEACEPGAPAASGNGASGVFAPSRSRCPSVARLMRADGPPVELRVDCRYERGC
jgi:hypothetical protein